MNRVMDWGKSLGMGCSMQKVSERLGGRRWAGRASLGQIREGRKVEYEDGGGDE